MSDLSVDKFKESLLTSEERKRNRVRSEYAKRSRQRAGHHSSVNGLSAGDKSTHAAPIGQMRPNGYYASTAYPHSTDQADFHSTIDYGMVPLVFNTGTHTSRTHTITQQEVCTPPYQIVPSSGILQNNETDVKQWPPFVGHPQGKVRLLHCPVMNKTQVPVNKAPLKGSKVRLLEVLHGTNLLQPEMEVIMSLWDSGNMHDKALIAQQVLRTNRAMYQTLCEGSVNLLNMVEEGVLDGSSSSVSSSNSTEPFVQEEKVHPTTKHTQLNVDRVLREDAFLDRSILDQEGRKQEKKNKERQENTRKLFKKEYLQHKKEGISQVAVESVPVVSTHGHEQVQYLDNVYVKNNTAEEDAETMHLMRERIGQKQGDTGLQDVLDYYENGGGYEDQGDIVMDTSSDHNNKKSKTTTFEDSTNQERMVASLNVDTPIIPMQSNSNNNSNNNSNSNNNAMNGKKTKSTNRFFTGPSVTASQPQYHVLHHPAMSVPGYSALSEIPLPQAVLLTQRICVTVNVFLNDKSAFHASCMEPAYTAETCSHTTQSTYDPALPVILFPPISHNDKKLFFPGVALPAQSLLPNTVSPMYLFLSLLRALLAGPHSAVVVEQACAVGIIKTFLSILERDLDPDVHLLLLNIIHYFIGDRGTDRYFTSKDTKIQDRKVSPNYGVFDIAVGALQRQHTESSTQEVFETVAFQQYQALYDVLPVQPQPCMDAPTLDTFFQAKQPILSKTTVETHHPVFFEANVHGTAFNSILRTDTHPITPPSTPAICHTGPTWPVALPVTMRNRFIRNSGIGILLHLLLTYTEPIFDSLNPSILMHLLSTTNMSVLTSTDCQSDNGRGLYGYSPFPITSPIADVTDTRTYDAFSSLTPGLSPRRLSLVDGSPQLSNRVVIDTNVQFDTTGSDKPAESNVMSSIPALSLNIEDGNDATTPIAPLSSPRVRATSFAGLHVGAESISVATLCSLHRIWLVIGWSRSLLNLLRSTEVYSFDDGSLAQHNQSIKVEGKNNTVDVEGMLTRMKQRARAYGGVSVHLHAGIISALNMTALHPLMKHILLQQVQSFTSRQVTATRRQYSHRAMPPSLRSKEDVQVVHTNTSRDGLSWNSLSSGNALSTDEGTLIDFSRVNHRHTNSHLAHLTRHMPLAPLKSLFIHLVPVDPNSLQPLKYTPEMDYTKTLLILVVCPNEHQSTSIYHTPQFPFLPLQNITLFTSLTHSHVAPLRDLAMSILVVLSANTSYKAAICDALMTPQRSILLNSKQPIIPHLPQYEHGVLYRQSKIFTNIPQHPKLGNYLGGVEMYEEMLTPSLTKLQPHLYTMPNLQSTSKPCHCQHMQLTTIALTTYTANALSVIHSLVLLTILTNIDQYAHFSFHTRKNTHCETPPALTTCDFVAVFSGFPLILNALRNNSVPLVHLCTATLQRSLCIARPSVLRQFQYFFGPVVMRTVIIHPFRVPPLLHILRASAPAAIHLAPADGIVGENPYCPMSNPLREATVDELEYIRHVPVQDGISHVITNTVCSCTLLEHSSIDTQVKHANYYLCYSQDNTLKIPLFYAKYDRKSFLQSLSTYDAHSVDNVGSVTNQSDLEGIGVHPVHQNRVHDKLPSSTNNNKNITNMYIPAITHSTTRSTDPEDVIHTPALPGLSVEASHVYLSHLQRQEQQPIINQSYIPTTSVLDTVAEEFELLHFMDMKQSVSSSKSLSQLRRRSSVENNHHKSSYNATTSTTRRKSLVGETGTSASRRASVVGIDAAKTAAIMNVTNWDKLTRVHKLQNAVIRRSSVHEVTPAEAHRTRKLEFKAVLEVSKKGKAFMEGLNYQLIEGITSASGRKHMHNVVFDEDTSLTNRDARKASVSKSHRRQSLVPSADVSVLFNMNKAPQVKKDRPSMNYFTDEAVSIA